MGTKKRCKCKACKRLFRPDPRARDRQKYCSSPSCQRASKAASHKRWLSKEENRNYFRGSTNVERVRVWRLAHPGYWRRKRPTTDALQDETLPQPTIAQVDSQLLQPDALQDLIFAQPAVIVGLISHLTGSALQDEIEVFTRKMQTRGQEILGMNPGIKTQGGLCYARKASVVFAGSANSTKAV